MSHHRRARTNLRTAVGVALVAMVTVTAVAACGDESNAEAQRKAEQLVTSAQAAGVASNLTVDTAEALYGDSAPGLCTALSDANASSAARLLLLGNPSGRRPKTLTDQAVTYGRLVVQTYCPEQTQAYDEVVADLSTVRLTR